MFVIDIGQDIYKSSLFPMICNVKIYVFKKSRQEIIKDYYFYSKLFVLNVLTLCFPTNNPLFRRCMHNTLFSIAGPLIEWQHFQNTLENFHKYGERTTPV